jgi:hypothetical protein
VEGALAPHRFSFAEAGSVYRHRSGFGATCASKSVLSCLPLGLQRLKPWRKRLIGWSITQRVFQGMAHIPNKGTVCDFGCNTNTRNQKLGSETRVVQMAHDCHMVIWERVFPVVQQHLPAP